MPVWLQARVTYRHVAATRDTLTVGTVWLQGTPVAAKSPYQPKPSSGLGAGGIQVSIPLDDALTTP